MGKFFLLFLFCALVNGSGKDELAEVTVNGEYYWELVLDIDNSQTEGKISKDVAETKEVSISYDDIIKNLSSELMSDKLFDIVQISVIGCLDAGVKAAYEGITKTRNYENTTLIQTARYEVGPHSSLNLYRLCFKAPGLSFRTATFASQRVNKPVAPIIFRIRQIYVLQDIEVVYTDYRSYKPRDAIEEYHGHSEDINKGFNGKYVYLRPAWSLNATHGATGISIVHQNSSDAVHNDLAGGVSSGFRYIDILKDPASRLRITRVVLWRSWSREDTPTTNGFYQFNTEDINRGRTGSWLRLAWNATFLPS